MAIQWNAVGQTYSIRNLNLEDDIASWFNSQFDSANIKPLIGPFPNVSPPRRTTNVYFIEDSRNWNKSTLMYDNQVYNDILMKYDIEKQLVYALNPLSLQPVTLNQKKVNWIKTSIGTFKPRVDSQGYFLIIFEGDKFSLIKESSKDLIVNSGEFKYKRYDSISLVSDDEQVPVRNARSFVKLFPSHKREIKKFMRLRQLREIKKANKEKYLIQIAEYCDNLSDL